MAVADIREIDKLIGNSLVKKSGLLLEKDEWISIKFCILT